MGIDIYFNERPKSSTQKIGYFRDSKLSHWLLHHVSGADNNTEIPLEKKYLQHLLNDLNRVTTDNRETIFPACFGEKDEDYWNDIHELKAWIKNTLQSFDFEANEIMFEIWV